MHRPYAPRLRRRCPDRQGGQQKLRPYPLHQVFHPVRRRHDGIHGGHSPSCPSSQLRMHPRLRLHPRPIEPEHLLLQKRHPRHNGYRVDGSTFHQEPYDTFGLCQYDTHMWEPWRATRNNSRDTTRYIIFLHRLTFLGPMMPYCGGQTLAGPHPLVLPNSITYSLGHYIRQTKSDLDNSFATPRVISLTPPPHQEGPRSPVHHTMIDLAHSPTNQPVISLTPLSIVTSLTRTSAPNLGYQSSRQPR